MKRPHLNRLPQPWLAILALALALAASAHAATPAAPAASTAAANAKSPKAEYRPVELAAWVPALRSPTRIILQPSGVSFNAELAGMPRPQKADYLQQALRTMQVSEPPQVGHAVLLKFGAAAEQQLVAYVDQHAAERMQRELRVGERREFFAFHVYNFSRGPALVITSFGPAR